MLTTAEATQRLSQTSSWGDWIQTYSSQKSTKPPALPRLKKFQDTSTLPPTCDPIRGLYQDPRVEERVRNREATERSAVVSGKLARDKAANLLRDYNIVSNEMHNSHSDKRFEGDKAWMGTSKVLQQSSRRQPHVGSTTSASEKVLTMSGKRHVAAEPYRMAFFDQFPSAIAEDARAALSPLKTTARAPATSGSGSGSGSTRPTRGERDFDIISNTQRASSVSHTAQQDEQVLAKAHTYFRANRIIDPIKGEYVDQDLEQRFKASRAVAERWHGGSKLTNLPPSILHSQGVAYNIISGEARDSLLTRYYQARDQGQRHDPVLIAIEQARARERDAHPHDHQAAETTSPSSLSSRLQSGLEGVPPSLAAPASLPPPVTFSAVGALGPNMEAEWNKRELADEKKTTERAVGRRCWRIEHVPRHGYDVLTNRPFVSSEAASSAWSSSPSHQESSSEAAWKIATWEASRLSALPNAMR